MHGSHWHQYKSDDVHPLASTDDVHPLPPRDIGAALAKSAGVCPRGLRSADRDSYSCFVGEEHI